jgi:hypothetical protein
MRRKGGDIEVKRGLRLLIGWRVTRLLKSIGGESLRSGKVVMTVTTFSSYCCTSMESWSRIASAMRLDRSSACLVGEIISARLVTREGPSDRCGDACPSRCCQPQQQSNLSLGHPQLILVYRSSRYPLFLRQQLPVPLTVCTLS